MEKIRKERNIKEGVLTRSGEAMMQNNIKMKVDAKRWLSLEFDESGAMSYAVTPLNAAAKSTYSPYLDAGITNEDSNWEDQFWNVLEVHQNEQQSFIQARTMKTHYNTCTFMQSQLFIDHEEILTASKNEKTDTAAMCSYTKEINQNQTYTIHKFDGSVGERNHHKNEVDAAAKKILEKAVSLGIEILLEKPMC